MPLAVLEGAAGAEGKAGAVHDVPAAVEVEPGVAEGEGLLDFGAGELDGVACDLRVAEAVEDALLGLAGFLVDFRARFDGAAELEALDGLAVAGL